MTRERDMVVVKELLRATKTEIPRMSWLTISWKHMVHRREREYIYVIEICREIIRHNIKKKRSKVEFKCLDITV